MLLSPLKGDRLHSRLQKGGSRDSKIVIINISVVWLDLDHVCMDRDWSSWALWWSKRIQGHFVAQSLLIFDISCLGLSPFKQSLIQSCRSASSARPTITFKVDKSWRRRQNLWTGLSSNSRQHFCICFHGCRPAFDRENSQNSHLSRKKNTILNEFTLTNPNQLTLTVPWRKVYKCPVVPSSGSTMWVNIKYERFGKMLPTAEVKEEKQLQCSQPC